MGKKKIVKVFKKLVNFRKLGVKKNDEWVNDENYSEFSLNARNKHKSLW